MSNNDWWSRKLGTPGASRDPLPPTSPAPYVPYRQQPLQGQQQPNVPVQYDEEQDQLLMKKAPSSRLDDKCPNCYSGNYFAPTGTQRMRCYDCGYPITQSGSGVGMPSDSSGPAQKAKQVSSSGFNPNVIVDRIG